MTEPDLHDEAIDRLLSHLSSVEPGLGFDDRMLQGVLSKRAQRPRLVSWFRLPVVAFAATTIALIYAVIAFHMPDPSNATLVANGRIAIPLQSPKLPVPQPTPAAHHSRRPHPGNQPQTSLDFPPPEPPLTAEEKLLLRVAHRPERSQVAILDPDERAELDFRDQVAFQQFFDPEPRPKKDHN